MNNSTSNNRISMLVCFAGKNRRIEINPQKVKISDNDFTYKTQYKADNGKTYLVSVYSIMDTNGSRANVEISDKHGNSICKRYGVEVRFYKRLFRK